MKKFLSVVLAVASMGVMTSLKGGEVAETMMLYLPNRIIDAFDLFSVNLGIGPTVRAELMATRFCVVGAGIGWQAKAFKDYNRQYGWGIQEGAYWSLISIGDESMERRECSPLVKNYYESFTGAPLPDREIYEYFDGERDFWQIGGALGLLVEGEVYLHPVEWLDFALGFLCVDIRGDDLQFDDFR